jgi:hypothetical protein
VTSAFPWGGPPPRPLQLIKKHVSRRARAALSSSYFTRHLVIRHGHSAMFVSLGKRDRTFVCRTIKNIDTVRRFNCVTGVASALNLRKTNSTWRARAPCVLIARKLSAINRTRCRVLDALDRRVSAIFAIFSDSRHDIALRPCNFKRFARS